MLSSRGDDGMLSLSIRSRGIATIDSLGYTRYLALWLSAGRTIGLVPLNHGNHAAEDHAMIILTVIGLLALFSLISFALGTDDWRQRGYTPRDEVMFWMRFGSH